MSIQTIAETYVALVKAGQHEELLGSLYTEDAVSIEPFSREGEPRATEGRAAIIGKSQWFEQNFRVERQTVSDPWPHGDDKFAVHMSFEMTHLASGHTSSTDEIVVLTVRGGKIAKEEFFYGRA